MQIPGNQNTNLHLYILLKQILKALAFEEYFLWLRPQAEDRILVHELWDFLTAGQMQEYQILNDTSVWEILSLFLSLNILRGDLSEV